MPIARLLSKIAALFSTLLLNLFILPCDLAWVIVVVKALRY
jgi:hypothetical protein